LKNEEVIFQERGCELAPKNLQGKLTSTLIITGWKQVREGLR